MHSTAISSTSSSAACRGGSFLADVTSFCADHGVDCRVEQRRRRLLSVEVRLHLEGPVDASTRSAAARSAYQCTPFMRLAIATCSMDARSSGSFLPFAAAESGKTL